MEKCGLQLPPPSLEHHTSFTQASLKTAKANKERKETQKGSSPHHLSFQNFPQEIHHRRIEENLLNKDIQIKVEKIKKQIEQDLCSSVPNAFWNRKKHKVSLPYVEGFDETQLPIKEKPIQMNT